MVDLLKDERLVVVGEEVDDVVDRVEHEAVAHEVHFEDLGFADLLLLEERVDLELDFGLFLGDIKNMGGYLQFALGVLALDLLEGDYVLVEGPLGGPLFEDVECLAGVDVGDEPGLGG